MIEFNVSMLDSVMRTIYFHDSNYHYVPKINHKLIVLPHHRQQKDPVQENHQFLHLKALQTNHA